MPEIITKNYNKLITFYLSLHYTYMCIFVLYYINPVLLCCINPVVIFIINVYCEN